MSGGLVAFAVRGRPAPDAPAREWAVFLAGRAEFFDTLAGAAATADLAEDAANAARAMRTQAARMTTTQTTAGVTW